MSNQNFYTNLGLTRQRLHEQIAERIETLIRAEELQSGDRLPSDRELAELMGVSRPTVREAIRLLQHRGLVLAKPGSGTYISSQRDHAVEDTLERYCSLSHCSHAELGELREVLEPFAATLAAARASAEDRQRLGALLEAYIAAHDARDMASYADIDMQLHLAIAGATQNKLLAVFYGTIARLIAQWTVDSAQATSRRDIIFEGFKDHVRCVRAILAGDAAKAHQSAATYAQKVHKLADRLSAKSQ